MFNIRDWTLKEQHDVTVVAVAAMTGFVSSLLFLNTVGITDLNARLAVTISWMLFLAVMGYREFHFPHDPLVSEKPSVDFAAILFALLTVASFFYAGYDQFTLAVMVIPVVLLVALPVYLVKTRRHTVLANPELTREDLAAVTKAYIRMALPSYRPFVKETYQKAVDKVSDMTFDMKAVTHATKDNREKTVRKLCSVAAHKAIRDVLVEALEKTNVEINDQRIFVEAGYVINKAALADRTITKEDFEAWNKRLDYIEVRLPKSLQDIAK